MTVGDFWGIAKSHPQFDSSEGVSSVFVNTKKGQELFEKMKSLADTEKATLEEGMIKQGNLINPTSRPIVRDMFYEKIDEPNFIKDLRVGIQVKNHIKSIIPYKIIQRIKAFI